MQCRICYDGTEDGTLLNPCNCKGETGAMHQSCLATWIRVSNRLSCEVCKAGYMIPDLVLEKTYKPHVLLLRLATYPYFVFSECLLMYIAYLSSHYRSSMVIYNSIIYSIPYILLIVMAAQALVMGPAIAKIQDKSRYIRYMFVSHKHPLIRFPIITYYVLAVAWFGLSWISPIMSSMFFLFIISKTYDFHCLIIKHINYDALYLFLADSV
jgi:hypothetical protein